MPDKTKLKDDDNSSEASGDTESSKDRKGSSDDIPQEEKGRYRLICILNTCFLVIKSFTMNPRLVLLML